jgi:DNA uptake protein ComE-like DNA-binding protein
MPRRAPSTFLLAAVVAAACATTVRHAVDLNAAPVEEIAALPGLSEADARRVVAGRPYYSREDLRVRKALPADVEARLGDRVYLGPPAMPAYLDFVPPAAEGP